MQGSVLVLSANLTAGLLSFTLARTIGRQLAQKVIQEEVGEGEGKAGVRAALQKVEDTIESGTFAQQCTSILLLRLTPIVPFRCCCCCCPFPIRHIQGSREARLTMLLGQMMHVQAQRLRGRLCSMC